MGKKQKGKKKKFGKKLKSISKLLESDLLLNQKDWLARTVEIVKRHAEQTAKKCTRMK